MKKTISALFLSLMFVMPVVTQATTPADLPNANENYPYYLAAGAVAGVVLFNLITGGVEAIPFVSSSSALFEGPVAANRVLTGVSMALGALAVDWGFKNLEVKEGSPMAKAAAKAEANVKSAVKSVAPPAHH